MPLHLDEPVGIGPRVNIVIRFEVLQLGRWSVDREALIASPVGAWFWFFNEAEHWREVPPQIDNEVMEAAMEILNGFRTDAHLNSVYRGQLEAERVESGRRRELADTLAAVEHERGEKERERAEKEAALAELAQLRASLGRDHG